MLIHRLGAGCVDAVDCDPVMVRLATSRLAADRSGGRANVRVGDMTATGARPESYDAVVDLGALHLEPNWRGALHEVRRVLRPGGRFYFEEIVRPSRQVLVPLATNHRISGSISHAGFLAELAHLGFDIVGTVRPRVLLLTGVIGDVIGVAERR
jgi:SAM-dependent methyltransferase